MLAGPDSALPGVESAEPLDDATTGASLMDVDRRVLPIRRRVQTRHPEAAGACPAEAGAPATGLKPRRSLHALSRRAGGNVTNGVTIVASAQTK